MRHQAIRALQVYIKKKTCHNEVELLSVLFSHIPCCFLGLVVGLLLARVADLDSDPALPGRVTRTGKIGPPGATLPGAWHCRVSIGTGWPSVSIV